mmetsp:Transcript_13718/g.41454  ORF Transcript_13718/g.41454 Transcript_13718/m.41454 type:complete len:129 (-) Transcript_13718:118-504(-)
MSRVLSCNAAPSEVPISEPSVITATIDLTKPVSAATWKIELLVDMTHSKRLLPITVTEAAYVPAGPSTVDLQVPFVVLEGLSRQQLLHYSLLQAILQDSSGVEVLRTGIVTEIYQAASQILRRYSDDS